MYKRGKYYYVFAPAGGVEEGWQTVLRAEHPFGAYEDRIVLKQGNTPVNGPHQGAWVELASGQSWFFHFQHKDAYGRIVHLQPMEWTQEDWPTMGTDIDGDGIGEPVQEAEKPDVGGHYPIAAPVTSDGFDSDRLGLQWQWQANPKPEWYSLTERTGYLRLFAQPNLEGSSSLYESPSLLLQKFPALSFRTTVRLDAAGLTGGNQAGLILFGYHYAALVYSADPAGGAQLQLIRGDTEREEVVWQRRTNAEAVWLRAVVRDGALCDFYYRADGEKFERVDQPSFQAMVSKWVGAKVGLYARTSEKIARGYADFDDFTVEEATGNEEEG
jgi:beta-xylosidase